MTAGYPDLCRPLGGRQVRRAAGRTNYTYLCDDGEWRDDPACTGPFGSIVLDGQYFDSEDDQTGEPRAATYSIIKGAPCCDWKVDAPEPTGDGVTWLDAADMPLLGDQSWLSIDSSYGEDFGNPVFAVACTARD